MSRKGDCIREANERLQDATEENNKAAMICTEKFLFICIESTLDQRTFDALQAAALKAHQADLAACEELPS